MHAPSPPPNQRIPHVAAVLALGMVITGIVPKDFSSIAYSQEAKPKPKPAVTVLQEEEETSILDQEPFDLITLDAANENKQYKVLPLLDGTRTSPFTVDLNATYRIRLIDVEDKQFDIRGSSIAKVELYEDLILKEARKLVADNKFDEAFDYFYLLRVNYPDLPQLDKAINDYLYLDAYQLTRSRKYSQALGLVEELLVRNPSYRYSATAPAMVDFLSGLLDRMLNTYVDERNYRAARILLKRVDKQYTAAKPKAVEQWIRQMETMARKRRDEAQKQLEAGNYRKAISASKEMIAIWPSIEGAIALNNQVSSRYPLITVGVIQPARTQDSQRLDNWSARRTGRLVNRSLVEFLGAGPEGGRYEFPLGLIERSEDQMQMIFRLNRLLETDSGITGYALAARLLDMATPASSNYAPAWSALVEGVEVVNVQQVDVDLRRPHVLPEAMLRVPMLPPSQTGGAQTGEAQSGELQTGESQDGQPGLAAQQGHFAVTMNTDEEVRFAVKGFQAGDRLAEIVEITYDDPVRALGALRRGEIDAVDRLFPADALRLQDDIISESPIETVQYALPTVHMLVPNLDKNPFLANRDFRRALVFGINRVAILNAELLGGREVYGCRVISGPFPAGTGDNDPLGYAYNSEVIPRRYDPRLSKLLTIVSQQQVLKLAEQHHEPEPKLEPFVLGHPAHEVARVTCQAIAAQLKIVGLEIQLKEFPLGVTRDEEGICDLVYTEIAIWEPVVDARRLFGPSGAAASDSPYLRQALSRLEEAQNWGDVRERLLQLHSAAHDEAIVIPLFQLVDFFAYNKRLRNVGEAPVWIYQNIDQWRMSSMTE